MSAGALAVEKYFQRLETIDDGTQLTACKRVQTLTDNQSVVINLRPLFVIDLPTKQYILFVEMQHTSAASGEEPGDAQFLYLKTSGGLCANRMRRDQPGMQPSHILRIHGVSISLHEKHGIVSSRKCI
jgi:hypothetical protein